MKPALLACLVVLAAGPKTAAAQLCVLPAPGDTVRVETKVTVAPRREGGTPYLEDVRWEGTLERFTTDSVFVRIPDGVRGALIPWQETSIQARCFVGTNPTMRGMVDGFKWGALVGTVGALFLGQGAYRSTEPRHLVIGALAGGTLFGLISSTRGAAEGRWVWREVNDLLPR